MSLHTPVSYTHLDVYKRQTLYCTHQPCVICAKMIINAGIRRIVYQEGYPDDFSLELMREANVVLERFVPEEPIEPSEG